MVLMTFITSNVAQGTIVLYIYIHVITSSINHQHSVARQCNSIDPNNDQNAMKCRCSKHPPPSVLSLKAVSFGLHAFLLRLDLVLSEGGCFFVGLVL